MSQSKLPKNCRALIVEAEAVSALALEYVLEDIGCEAIGPVWRANDIQQRVRREAPNFALVDSNLRHHLVPAIECLNLHRVPFALLAMGAEGGALDDISELRDRPRVERPFHGPTMYRAAQQLYRNDLEEKIARADQRIAEGQRRLAQQLRLIERSWSNAGEDNAAQILAREIARGLRAMRASRALLLEQLEAISVE